MRKKPKLLPELISREAEEAVKDERLAQHIESMLASRIIIENAETVKVHFKNATGEDISIVRVHKVLRANLGMHFRKIVNLPFHANSERCRV